MQVKISEEQREKLIKARQHGLSLRVRQGGNSESGRA
jgi:hypothetical protein